MQGEVVRSEDPRLWQMVTPKTIDYATCDDDDDDDDNTTGAPTTYTTSWNRTLDLIEDLIISNTRSHR